ncbi:FxSxx-COOH system tetratricopeptide repeat protein [Actinoplanes sp. TRM 88003]|uniref:FxSxx-COOH system tetratricopeptide repeat protein n=1 Tax=Paractinoplanes aksuensis TaxID=2939490 RepID=A0ABT1DDX6_9ACTN|nr:FxSxx-COOH system tetratricopeptide repeat protein [Actinoplanes aksuensis]MCO8269013.1 FxSxx-COOH system tetratricopeptide repeat protein [Actinoplanes aksuensis]
MTEKVSHETVNALLNNAVIPKWSKVEPVVRVLAETAAHRPDPQAEVQRFLALWNARTDNKSGMSPPAGPVEVEPPSVELPHGSVPPRKPGFTGREDLLELMKQPVGADAGPWRPMILHGLSGVGKTSLATEFVHRERAHYDVVWWIVAEQVAPTRAALAQLADRLPEQVEISQSDVGQTVLNLLGALERATYTWLLVYDNAIGPEHIRELLPTAGRGTVIVTTRDGRWNEHGRTVPVGVMPRQDSIALLQRSGRISFDDADLLAHRLGDLPLALEQASAMRSVVGISVAEYLRRLDRQATAVLSLGRPRDYPETVAGAFGLAFDEVKRVSVGAGQLLAMLSCMSAEPISPALLRTATEHSIPPPLGRVLAQDNQLDAALRLLERYGLITAADGGQKVQVHRLVQLVVRDSLSDDDLDGAFDNARRLLVAANPHDPDDPLTWEMHAQIGHHIGLTGLIDSVAPPMRRVVLDQIRYLYLLGDFDGSLRLTDKARQAWAGPGDVWDDDETFACIDRYALNLVALGRYNEADKLYDLAWKRLNNHEQFGANHDRTARTANGVAMVSRILGSYGKAANLERYRMEYYQRTRGDNNVELLRARSNMALCHRAIGEFEKAREIDEDLVRLWRQAHGDNDYRTQFAVSNLARDLYGLGRYEEVLRLQEEILPAMRDRLGDRHPSVMLAARTTAIALRKTGRVAEALRASQQHHLICQGEWGSENGNTLAAAMTYANAVRVAVAARLPGAPSLTYTTSLRTVNTYRARFGETNPVALAAAVNHAIILRLMGDRNTARRTCESAYRQLQDQVGAAHPYVHAAAVGLANDLVVNNDIEAAGRLLRTTLESARAAKRERHPDMLICAVNLGIITRERDPAGAATLIGPALTALRELLGPDHPQVRAAADGERGECDIEPPPF